MSNFGDKGRRKRLRWRHLLPLAVLALGSILLVPAGSAKPTPVTKFEICVQNATAGTPTPTCGGAATSVFNGNTIATLNVSVENDGTSTTAIQSANINLPSQLIGVATSGSPSSNVTVSTSNLQVVQIRGVRIQPGNSFVATFRVYVACGGQFSWGASEAASGDNLTGTSFGYQPSPSSTGVSTTITTNATTGCHLGFVTQPTDTQNGLKILDAGASHGDAIKVGLFLGTTTTRMTSCPVGYSTCSVAIDRTPADGALTNGAASLTQPLLQDAGNGNARVATFSDLSINVTPRPEQFRLTATGSGSFAPTVNSDSFLIADDVSSVSCPGGQCSLSQKHLNGAGLTESFADLTSAAGFTFMTLSPYTLGDRVPAGCAGRITAGIAGFAESDGRIPGGEVKINYFVDKDQLKARYGKNVGEQFIPICAGGRPVDATSHKAVDCTTLDAVGGNDHGWAAQKLTAKGTFAGVEQNAICDADGYYWGIMSSYQDKIPAGNPVVSGWGGQNIGGKNFRFFEMTIPAGWDWRSGP